MGYLEEQRELFHEDILDFGRPYQGSYNEKMMGDYIWVVIHEVIYTISEKNYLWSILCNPKIYAIFLIICRFVPSFRERECTHSPAIPMGIGKFQTYHYSGHKITF